VEGIAAGEPPVLAIDTLERAGKAVARADPSTAGRLYQEAARRTLALRDLSTRRKLLPDIVQGLAETDLEAAEGFCRVVERELRAVCYGAVYRATDNWADESALFRRALSSGAFDDRYVNEHLRRASEKAAGELGVEFAAAVEGFPEPVATEGEIRRLLGLIEFMKGREPLAERWALARARRATDRLRLREADLRKPVEEKKEEQKDAEPDTEGMTPSEKIVLARKSKPGIAAGLLYEAADQDDAMPAARQLSLLAEALDASAGMKPNDDKLVTQALIARKIFELGDRPRAALGAQILAETFQKVYDCESAACDKVRDGDTPGELIFSFAEYIDEKGISAEDLGLSHPSLRARMLVIELKTAVAGKKERNGLFR
jgi:hypothetical protein